MINLDAIRKQARAHADAACKHMDLLECKTKSTMYAEEKRLLFMVEEYREHGPAKGGMALDYSEVVRKIKLLEDAAGKAMWLFMTQDVADPEQRDESVRLTEVMLEARRELLKELGIAMEAKGE